MNKLLSVVRGDGNACPVRDQVDSAGSLAKSPWLRLGSDLESETNVLHVSAVQKKLRSWVCVSWHTNHTLLAPTRVDHRRAAHLLQAAGRRRMDVGQVAQANGAAEQLTVESHGKADVQDNRVVYRQADQGPEQPEDLGRLQ